jgi:gliding motility-associated-like protein
MKKLVILAFALCPFCTLSSPNIDAGEDIAVCGLQAYLSGESTFENLLWIATDSAITIENNNSLQTLVKSSSYGRYLIVLEGTDNGITYYDSLYITFLAHTTVDAGEDQHLCLGDATQLDAYATGDFYWSPSTGLDNPYILNPTISTIQHSTTYTLSSTTESENMIINHDFDQGYSMFHSAYDIPDTIGPYGWLSDEGFYLIGTDASTTQINFQGFDHSNPPSGNFMIVNGATVANTKVWCQNIAVAPQTNYSFSTWVSSMNTVNPSILEFSVNNNLLGNPFNAPSIVNQWIEYSSDWYSELNTSAEICIVNQNTIAGGNDFGLDDISFKAYCENTDEVTINVHPRTSLSNTDISQCENSKGSNLALFDLTSLEDSISHYKPLKFFLDKQLTQAINQPSSISLPNNSRAYVTLDNDSLCSDTATINIQVLPSPIASFSHEVKLLENCNTQIQLNNTSSTIGNYHWTINNNPISQARPIFTVVPDSTILVSLSISNTEGCKDSISQHITTAYDSPFFAPNAFTPDKDPFNEHFNVFAKCISDFYLEIYSRWGELLFSSSDLHKGWDGTFKNQLCQNGVYAWIVKYTDTNNVKQTKTGTVSLMR